METIMVDVGKSKVSNEKNVIFQSCLGSCVGVTLFDATARIGGLIHILLPESFKGNKGALSPSRFADIGIPCLIEEMLELGASRENIMAKAAGGSLIYVKRKQSVDMNIGGRNSSMVIKTLKKESIEFVSHDLGGNFGRVIQLHIATGRVTVRLIGQKDEELQ